MNLTRDEMIRLQSALIRRMSPTARRKCLADLKDTALHFNAPDCPYKGLWGQYHTNILAAARSLLE